MSEKRVLFLKSLIDDMRNDERKSFPEYGAEWEENPEKLRKWFRNFKDIYYERGQWMKDEEIEDDWATKIINALSLEEDSDGEGFWSKKWGKPGNWSFSYERDSVELVEKLELAVDSMRKIVAEKAEPIKINNTKSGKLRLNVYGADKHVGAYTRNSLFGNEYDPEIFKQRMQAMLCKVEEVAKTYGRLGQIAVIDLGDGVDGADAQTARKGHKLDQNLETIEQFETFISVHKEFFHSLIKMDIADSIKFIGCTNDNHGGSFSYMTIRALEEYIKGFFPDIETLVSPKFMFWDEYGVHRFIYTHGKDDRYMKNGFPIQLNAKSKEIIEDYIDYHGLATHLPYPHQKSCIHLIKGDLHTTNEEFAKKFRYKNIMSVYGSSSYVQHNYGAGYAGFEYELFEKDTPEFIGGKYFYDFEQNTHK